MASKYLYAIQEVLGISPLQNIYVPNLGTREEKIYMLLKVSVIIGRGTEAIGNWAKSFKWRINNFWPSKPWVFSIDRSIASRRRTGIGVYLGKQITTHKAEFKINSNLVRVVWQARGTIGILRCKILTTETCAVDIRSFVEIPWAT